MPSPSALREFRFLSGTTFNATFANAASANWNAADATATKLRVTEYDDSGLVQEGIPDATMQTRMYAKPAPIPGLRRGVLKFSTYLGAAYSGAANITNPPQADLLECFMGGMRAPTTGRSGVIAGGSTSTNINFPAANTYLVAGQAVLVGVKGDGRGNGEVKPVNAVTPNSIGMAVACSDAPVAGDAIVFSTTGYPDGDATQSYIDTLAIGHATADQRQTIGGMGTFSISGMNAGELPQIGIELSVADHQYVASGDRTTLTPGTAPAGTDPPFERGIGLVHIGDNGASTRTAIKCGELAFNPGIAYQEIPNLGGVNGCGGWQKIPGVPTAEITLLFDEDFGLVADFVAGTAKSFMFQMGHTAAKCCAIELPRAYLTALPTPKALNNLQGMKILVHGDEGYVAGNTLLSAAFRIHWF